MAAAKQRGSTGRKNPPRYPHVGQRIRELRERARPPLSQEKAARAAGRDSITAKTWQRWEAGDHLPRDPEDMLAIAKVLGVEGKENLLFAVFQLDPEDRARLFGMPVSVGGAGSSKAPAAYRDFCRRYGNQYEGDQRWILDFLAALPPFPRSSPAKVSTYQRLATALLMDALERTK